MGGIQVVFCGDFFQLPPVSKSPHIGAALGSSAAVGGNSSYSKVGAGPDLQNGSGSGLRFCFQSDLWPRLVQESFDLQQVYRQSGDTAFIDALNCIRGGEFSEQCRSVLGGCVGRKLDCSDGILPTQIFTHKYVHNNAVVFMALQWKYATLIITPYLFNSIADATLICSTAKNWRSCQVRRRYFCRATRATRRICV